MENSVCRICLKPVKISKDIVSFQDVLKEVFSDIVNKQTSSLNDCAFCDSCATTLEMAFSFKSEYATAAEFISLHLTTKTKDELSLTKMYCKSNNLDNHNVKVCRICLKSSEECSSFVIPLENKKQQEMLEKYLPDLVENNIQDSYICDSCSVNLTWFLTFISDCLKVEQKMNENLARRRSKHNKKQCPHCSYFGKCLEQHIRVHEDSSKASLFECDICKSTFVYKRSMESHRRTLHTNKQTFSCSKCDFTTNRKPGLKRHVLRRHTDKSKLDPFKCKKCSFETHYKSDIIRHMNMKHNEEEIQRFHCDKCSYSSPSNGHLKRHIAYVHKDISEIKTYNCELCTYISKDKSNLKKHMAKHSTEKSVKCSKCSFTTKYDISLKQHMIHVHGEVHEMFQCEFCNYASKSKSNLSAHIKILHNKNYSEHVCDICGFKTSRKGNMVYHMILHKDTFDYKCKYCSFETKHKSSIIRHYEVMHDKKWKNG